MNTNSMNCAECRDNLVACLEGLLDNEQTRQCRAHFESCAACRAEYEATSRLQARLAARGVAVKKWTKREPVATLFTLCLIGQWNTCVVWGPLPRHSITGQ